MPPGHFESNVLGLPQVVRDRHRSARSEHLQPLAFGGLGLLVVQRDELENRRMGPGNYQGGADLKGIRRAKRMRLDEALGMTPHELDRGHFRPALPGGQRLATRLPQVVGRPGLRTPAASQCREELDS